MCERARLARDARFDGRFFIAVTSTGIYCRPICPARSPRAAHVRYYASAAEAAEAGFRPCLRCRPEAAPGTPAWRGSSALVGRAVRLIGEGACADGRHRRAGGAARHRPATSPSAVRPARRRAAGRRRADVAARLREAAPRRDHAAGDAGGAGVGLRQHPPVQRRVSRRVSAPAVAGAAPPGAATPPPRERN